MSDERLDPTDPQSQAEPDDERIEDLEHEIEGVRGEVARHQGLEEDEGKAVAPPG